MRIQALTLNRQALSDFEDAIQKEWIITNGLGGYASSTVLGINTRKYHGLLVAAFHPPGNRRVCLEKLDEEIRIGSSIHPLGANEFESGVFPKGYGYLREFALSPFPRYIYSVQGVEMEKTVFMPHERNATVVLYKVMNRSGSEIRIQAFPLVNWRHFHLVTNRWKMNAEPKQKQLDPQTGANFRGSKSPLIMKAIGATYHSEGKWIEKMRYREEAKRGESCSDDVYQSGFFEVKIDANRNESFAIVAAADGDAEAAQRIVNEMPLTMYDMGALYDREAARHENFLARFYGTHVGIPQSDWLSMLVSNTDMFLVKAAEAEKSVIAGYHWFEAWGRDAFVSLPGLMLVTERFEDARKVFLHFSKHCKDGLIPNFVPDSAGGQPAYNSVDATLWFVDAVLQYLKYTDDFKFVQENLWHVLKGVIESHVKGTVFGIRAGNDGLLSHGGQLTWMDVAIDGKAVTPRAGKAVEVQALWYNALRIVELLASRFTEAC
jgi:predicted glycogen debranching enzyme